MAGHIHAHTHEDLYIITAQVCLYLTVAIHLKSRKWCKKDVELCLYDAFGSQFDPNMSLALCLKPGVIFLRGLTHVHSSQSRFGSHQTAQPDTSDET